MPAPRPFAAVHDADLWRRCAFECAALRDGVVQLAWDDAPDAPPGAAVLPAGLAFDAHCRLFRSVPEEGRVDRRLWAATDPLGPAAAEPPATNLFAAPAATVHGDFTATAPVQTPAEPRGLAVDERNRLFVADTAGRAVWVIDADERRVLRRVSVPGAPLGLAAHGLTVYAALGTAVVRFSRGFDPVEVKLPAELSAPTRLTVGACGRPFVLSNGRVGPQDGSLTPLAVPGATDLAYLPAARELVVARGPGDDFLRFSTATGWEDRPRLTARGYLGGGIVATPDGRVGFWTAHGFRHAVAARTRYQPTGVVTTFRLDSGSFRTEWGRLFLDACVPAGTAVRAACVSADEPPEGPEEPRTDPVNVTPPAAHPEASPPMPPRELMRGAPAARPPHRRETGRERPWTEPPADGFATYELPVDAPPGRFLWVRLELSGNTRATPRVRSLRAEHPGHDYLARLPRTFSREPAAAAFLTHFLAPVEGVLGDLEARSDGRHALLDPCSAPADVLPWLASFVGLATDERWPERVTRAVIAEAAWLFRFRGTVPGLTRFLELVAGVPVVVVELFRFRGTSGTEATTAVVGGGLRVGGAVGVPGASVSEETFDRTAHRFAVVLAGDVCPDALAAVRHVLEVHRPAHTAVEVCSAAGGMRVGRGLHLGLTTVVGRSGGWERWQVGGAVGLLGAPAGGTTPGASRVGVDARVG